MSIWKSVFAVVGAFLLILFAPAAVAQDDEYTMSMISLFEIDPSKEKQFEEAWTTIRETAMANGYEYTDYVGGRRNERWIVTPLRNFADVDALFAARDAVSEAGGSKFEKALANFIGAMTNSHSFFVRDDDELSYWPEGYEPGPFMEIDTVYYRYGARDEMRAVLADYKALMEEKESPYGYQVSWDWIGAEGNSFTIVTYAENELALAEAKAAQDAMLEGDEEAEALFERFLKVVTGSDTMHSVFNPDASINLPEEEE